MPKETFFLAEEVESLGPTGCKRHRTYFYEVQDLQSANLICQTLAREHKWGPAPEYLVVSSGQLQEDDRTWVRFRLLKAAEITQDMEKSRWEHGDRLFADASRAEQALRRDRTTAGDGHLQPFASAKQGTAPDNAGGSIQVGDETATSGVNKSDPGLSEALISLADCIDVWAGKFVCFSEKAEWHDANGLASYLMASKVLTHLVKEKTPRIEAALAGRKGLDLVTYFRNLVGTFLQHTDEYANRVDENTEKAESEKATLRNEYSKLTGRPESDVTEARDELLSNGWPKDIKALDYEKPPCSAMDFAKETLWAFLRSAGREQDFTKELESDAIQVADQLRVLARELASGVGGAGESKGTPTVENQGTEGQAARTPSTTVTAKDQGKAAPQVPARTWHRRNHRLADSDFEIVATADKHGSASSCLSNRQLLRVMDWWSHEVTELSEGRGPHYDPRYKDLSQPPESCPQPGWPAAPTCWRLAKVLASAIESDGRDPKPLWEYLKHLHENMYEGGQIDRFKYPVNIVMSLQTKLTMAAASDAVGRKTSAPRRRRRSKKMKQAATGKGTSLPGRPPATCLEKDGVYPFYVLIQGHKCELAKTQRQIIEHMWERTTSPKRDVCQAVDAWQYGPNDQAIHSMLGKLNDSLRSAGIRMQFHFREGQVVKH